jgi:tetratricopeptide (TPR) repeat protein
MSEDSEENNLLQALEHYKEGLSSLEELSDDAGKAFQMMLQTLISRDEIEEFRGKLSAKFFLELDVLDEALESNRDKFFWITWFAKRSPVKLRQYRKLEVYERNGWWWQCTYHISFWKYAKRVASLENIDIAVLSRKFFGVIISASNSIAPIRIKCKRWLQSMPPYEKIAVVFRNTTRELRRIVGDFEIALSPIINKFDWCWKFLTIVCLIASLCLLIHALPRFWAAGITPEGVAGIILPSALTFVLGKDTFEQITNGYGILEKSIKRMPFPVAPVLRQELAFLISIFFLFGTLSFHARSLSATPGVKNGEDKPLKELLCKATFLLSGTETSDYSISKAEDDLKRTISIKPDHPNAHLHLGWLYELRQDLKGAETEYSLSMQNGSLNARNRLAGLYLISDIDKLSDK